ncbi:hypothetical protein ACLNGM_15055 [Aureimonas phyllosphaerae]|uniref:hypothetical protein n=1 Tax=Aureimonas phyllosphaerae TaxID=1166078 RepID=UPI003A5C318D
MAMEKSALKTEHCGPKRGRGAWCRKAVAKAHSNKYRRRADARAIRQAIVER